MSRKLLYTLRYLHQTRLFCMLKRNLRHGSNFCLMLLLSNSVPIKLNGGNKENLETKDSSFNLQHLIQNASTSTLSSSIALMLQSLTGLIEAMKKYQEVVKDLSELYELSINVAGSHQLEDQVWDEILKARAHLNLCRSDKEELERIYISSRKVVESAAEAAFLSGAEYASISANEMLQSSEVHLKQHKNKTDALEEVLIEIEVKCIKNMSEREETQSAENEQKQILSLEDLAEDENDIKANLYKMDNEGENNNAKSSLDEDKSQNSKDSNNTKTSDDNQAHSWYNFEQEKIKEDKEFAPS